MPDDKMVGGVKCKVELTDVMIDDKLYRAESLRIEEGDVPEPALSCAIPAPAMGPRRDWPREEELSFHQFFFTGEGDAKSDFEAYKEIFRYDYGKCNKYREPLACYRWVAAFSERKDCGPWPIDLGNFDNLFQRWLFSVLFISEALNWPPNGDNRRVILALRNCIINFLPRPLGSNVERAMEAWADICGYHKLLVAHSQGAGVNDPVGSGRYRLSLQQETETMLQRYLGCPLGEKEEDRLATLLKYIKGGPAHYKELISECASELHNTVVHSKLYSVFAPEAYCHDSNVASGGAGLYPCVVPILISIEDCYGRRALYALICALGAGHVFEIVVLSKGISSSSDAPVNVPMQRCVIGRADGDTFFMLNGSGGLHEGNVDEILAAFKLFLNHGEGNQCAGNNCGQSCDVPEEQVDHVLVVRSVLRGSVWYTGCGPDFASYYHARNGVRGVRNDAPISSPFHAREYGERMLFNALKAALKDNTVDMDDEWVKEVEANIEDFQKRGGENILGASSRSDDNQWLLFDLEDGGDPDSEAESNPEYSSDSDQEESERAKEGRLTKASTLGDVVTSASSGAQVSSAFAMSEVDGPAAHNHSAQSRPSL